MQSTRQFTKRRPQSPMQQQKAVGLATASLSAAPVVPTPFTASQQPGVFNTFSESTVTVQPYSEPLHATNMQKQRSNSGHDTAVGHVHPHPAYEPSHHHNEHGDAHHHDQHNHSHPDHDHAHHGHDHAHHGHVHNEHTHGHPYMDQAQHAHAGHDHHGHNHLAHDHHGHDHHGHAHHGHDHHGHAHHGHSHHGHEHHDFAPVYVTPLPSWSTIFSNLAPMQKTIFTWLLIHSTIGFFLWSAGTSSESLSIVGYSYLVLFDALGVLNLFLSEVVQSNPVFHESNTKRPFGARRYELVFAMATTVYLLFVTMYNTKEVLEHSLTEHDSDVHHGESSIGFGTILLVFIGMAATFLSSVSFKNHENFVRHLRRQPPTVHGFSYNVLNRSRGSALNVLLSNVYSFSIVSCGAVILLFCLFAAPSPFVDKFLAFGESVVMFYLGGPTAMALAKLLLQTTPALQETAIENRLIEIRRDPRIIAIDRIHFWQNTYGKCIGTLEVQIRPEADEQQVLQFVYEKLEGLTSSETDGESELTVSIIKQ